ETDGASSQADAAADGLGPAVVLDSPEHALLRLVVTEVRLFDVRVPSRAGHVDVNEKLHVATEKPHATLTGHQTLRQGRVELSEGAIDLLLVHPTELLHHFEPIVALVVFFDDP